MKISSIIHARTFKVDFRPKLLFAPDDIEVHQLRLKIDEAASNFTYKTGFRWVALADNEHVIAGVIGYINNLYALCGEAPRFNKDIFNRDMLAFIALCFKRNDFNRAANEFIITPKVLLDVYEKYMPLRWDEEESSDVDRIEYIEYVDSNIMGNAPYKNMIIEFPNKKSDVKYYVRSGENDYNIFISFLRYIQKGSMECSMCTNFQDSSVLEKSGFDYITCEDGSNEWLKVDALYAGKQNSTTRISYPSNDTQYQSITGNHRYGMDFAGAGNDTSLINKTYANNSGKLKDRFNNAIRSKLGNQNDRDEKIYMLTETQLKQLINEGCDKRCKTCPYKKGR